MGAAPAPNPTCEGGSVSCGKVTGQGPERASGVPLASPPVSPSQSLSCWSGRSKCQGTAPPCRGPSTPTAGPCRLCPERERRWRWALRLGGCRAGQALTWSISGVCSPNPPCAKAGMGGRLAEGCSDFGARVTFCWLRLKVWGQAAGSRAGWHQPGPGRSAAAGNSCGYHLRCGSPELQGRGAVWPQS